MRESVTYDRVINNLKDLKFKIGDNLRNLETLTDVNLTLIKRPTKLLHQSYPQSLKCEVNQQGAEESWSTTLLTEFTQSLHSALNLLIDRQHIRSEKIPGRFQVTFQVCTSLESNVYPTVVSPFGFRIADKIDRSWSIGL